MEDSECIKPNTEDDKGIFLPYKLSETSTSLK